LKSKCLEKSEAKKGRGGREFKCSVTLSFESKGTFVHMQAIRGLLEKYPTFGREKETGLLGALDT